MIDRLAPILLFAGCVAFAGIVAAELTAPQAPQTSAAGAAPSRPQPLPPAARTEARTPDAVMVETILARPLFAATRRPPARGGGPAPDSSLSDTRLAGIVTEPGRRFAVFAPSGGKPMTVGEGDMVGAWRVDSITPVAVKLSGPDGTKTLEPKIDPNLAPPAPPPGAAPRPVPPVNPAAFRPAVRPGMPVRPGVPPAFLQRSPLRPGQARAR